LRPGRVDLRGQKEQSREAPTRKVPDGKLTEIGISEREEENKGGGKKNGRTGSANLQGGEPMREGRGRGEEWLGEKTRARDREEILQSQNLVWQRGGRKGGGSGGRGKKNRDK